ncbi:MAG: Cna B-type domain-containing protein [Lachnospiraceae bacterium]|nr:Cna B-type domain-containing protein [Lachnospiraceae bacterium]
MKNKLKRLASLILSAMLILSIAMPAFAAETVECKVITKATVKVDFVWDDMEDQWGLRGDGVVVTLYNDGKPVEGCTKTVKDGDTNFSWEFSSDKDTWVEDKFEVRVTAPEHYAKCYDIEIQGARIWGSSSDEIASDGTDVIEEVTPDEELEGCYPVCWKFCCDCGTKYDCDKGHKCSWIDCPDCGKKYDCSKKHECKKDCDWKFCYDCGEKYDCKKGHACHWTICPCCEKKYDCRKEHDCPWKICPDCGQKYEYKKGHKCPWIICPDCGQKYDSRKHPHCPWCPTPPTPTTQPTPKTPPTPPEPVIHNVIYGFSVQPILLKRELALTNFVDDESGKDTYFGFNIKITSPIDDAKVYADASESLRDHTKNGDIWSLVVPRGSKYVVTETEDNGYNVNPESKVISGKLLDDYEAQFVNYKGDTPVPPPGPTPGPTPGGGGSSTVATGPAQEEVSTGPVVEEAPKTGMPMEYYVWLLAMIVSAGAVATLVYKKNRIA